MTRLHRYKSRKQYLAASLCCGVMVNKRTNHGSRAHWLQEEKAGTDSTGSGDDAVVNSIRAVGGAKPILATQIISRALNGGRDAAGWQRTDLSLSTGWIRPKSYTRCRDQSVALEFRFPINPSTR